MPNVHILSTFCHFCSPPMIIIIIFSFHDISKSTYAVEIKADNDIVSVYVPENVTGDVAGNKNLPSNVLQVRHCKDSYSVLLSSAQLLSNI